MPRKTIPPRWLVGPKFLVYACTIQRTLKSPSERKTFRLTEHPKTLGAVILGRRGASPPCDSPRQDGDSFETRARLYEKELFLPTLIYYST